MSPDFWRGEKVRLFPVEPDDLEVLLSLEEDADLDRYEDVIRFPATRAQGPAFFEKMAERDGKDDTFSIVLRYYFHELRCQKATVIVYAFNERSKQLHEGLGFRLEGRLRRTVYTNGRLHDELYSV